MNLKTPCVLHRYRLLIIIFLLANKALAQPQPTFTRTLVPDEKVHDFGTILEEKGPVSHTFVLRNLGERPVVITSATAWCSCTTADWQKSPIAPGQSGTVTVSYNPAYRPGKFSKEVAVVCDDGKHYVRLWVKGTVAGMEHPASEDYPYAYGGGLRMNSRVLPFRALKKGEKQTIGLGLANDTGRPMRIVFRREPDNRVLHMPDSLTLKPHERRKLAVSYTAVREYPYRRHIDITPIVNGKVAERLRVTWLPQK